MRLIFMGTPAFAVPALEAVHEAGHEIALVVTRPDKPRGRSGVPVPSDVKLKAGELGLEVYQPEKVTLPEALERLSALRPEAILVAAYGGILPRALLEMPPHGCINIHGSLLPAWRGAAPIERAIMAGDAETGITIMAMEPGIDTGPMYASRVVNIGPDEDRGSVYARLSRLGAEMVTGVLEEIAAGTAVAERQDDSMASLAPKVEPAEMVLDWRQPAKRLHDLVRALSPAPGARTTFHGAQLKVFRTKPSADFAGERGRIIVPEKGRLIAGCGEGSLELLEVQVAGRRSMSAADFSAGHRDLAGELLGDSQ